MTTVAGEWLANAATQSVFALLDHAGHQVFAVGGCVRNTLLGALVRDVDFATDARPERVTELAEAAGMRAVPTGIRHGTVTLVTRGQGFEVTTFRRDIETDGRRAKVTFSDTVAEDARRRDFTMNALYARAEGGVVDPLGGLADVRARRVRFIGDAEARIREDYLRILRFFRFHAWYGDPAGGIDATALAACAALAAGIDTLSAERKGAEMRRLLTAEDPAPAIAAMARSGVLARVLPGSAPDALAPLVHFEAATGAAPDWIRRLAALGGEEATELLRLSRAFRRKLTLFRREKTSRTPLAEIAYRHGAAAAHDIALLRAALLCEPPASDLGAQLTHAAQSVFPLSGRDLASRFHGPDLGRELERLERIWIESGFALGREDLLAS